MTQNIYDDPEFFAGYSRLPRSLHGLAGAPEWPALRALLPRPSGLRIVDLGCGFGWFCRWARAEGAAQVLGIDISERMLERAGAEPKDEAIVYERADLNRLELPEGGFDLAYSSLALHYVEDLERLFATVRRSLVPGARFVFSIEHPIYMAPRRPGWIADRRGGKSWPVDSYQMEGARRSDWIGAGVVKYHRTLGTTLNRLIRQGFVIRHVEEFGPSDEQVAQQAELAEERERPMFLLVAADRAGP
ncbi:bifunctional 2-polyprenyl-6-hydroxyphenol methylase/3-demethylubiquinol 3-O-methyltransferase UbiG [Sphingosinicella sp. CPCC 101087]|uniref:class I SAM-dependent methyltransferase n=1 Tax=Sphingosinicella sp. CPCC 101087 TaxID=2497754 RepID=UPI00101C4DB5|nr:class I SAM-dependent methyltransferase [Sphingosinicella sp. CPCC 101087]